MSKAAVETDRTAAGCPRYDQRLVRRLMRPGPGWTRPCLKTAPNVWEHTSGLRCIPMTNIGQVVIRLLPDGPTVFHNEDKGDLKMAIKVAGNKRRGVLAWASTLLPPNNQCEARPHAKNL